MSTESTKVTTILEEQVINQLKDLLKDNEFYKAGQTDDGKKINIETFRLIKDMLKSLLNPDINPMADTLIRGFILEEKIQEEDLTKPDIQNIIETHKTIIDKVNKNIEVYNDGMIPFDTFLQDNNFGEENIKKIKSSFTILDMILRVNVLNRLHFKHTLSQLRVVAGNKTATETLKNELTNQLVNRLSGISKILVSSNLDNTGEGTSSNKYKLFNNNNNYLSKYMKYKNKYLSLKNNNYF